MHNFLHGQNGFVKSAVHLLALTLAVGVGAYIHYLRWTNHNPDIPWDISNTPPDASYMDYFALWGPVLLGAIAARWFMANAIRLSMLMLDGRERTKTRGRHRGCRGCVNRTAPS